MSSPATIVQPSLRTAAGFAALYSVFVVFVAYAPHRVAEVLDYENGFVELLSAFAYVGGCVAAVMLARRTTGWARAHWLMWAVLCVIFFGEETSWLQSWLRYDTPESVKGLNAQGEFNLHNLGIFSLLPELLGEAKPRFDWRYLMDSQLIFSLGFGTYFFVFPLLMLRPAIRRFAVRFGFPVLRERFLLMTWIPIVASMVLTYLHRHDWARKSLIGETREMFFALTICAFIAIAYEFISTPSGSAR